MLLVTSDLTECIGRTPLLALERLFPDAPAAVFAKLELMNPISIKDRAVLGMIKAAIREGQISPRTEVVEATLPDHGGAFRRGSCGVLRVAPLRNLEGGG